MVHSCQVLWSRTPPISCRGHRQLPPAQHTLLPFPSVSRSPGAELATAASQLVREQVRRLTQLQTVLVLWAKELSRG